METKSCEQMMNDFMKLLPAEEGTIRCRSIAYPKAQEDTAVTCMNLRKQIMCSYDPNGPPAGIPITQMNTFELDNERFMIKEYNMNKIRHKDISKKY
eukprot:CAMPEP_0173170208 /NCGR_PEP_ID=MMETSP1141-20130122/1113_1 /TAXON_ID=483371 /ORGANISM="non described non described, Strain CCMP2298" /LENGTH=96 /DNA_ID=CAMNT_0014092083 /DNA_START=53 /DNA_END=343 /DNA_ORIENTATION=-